MPAGVVARGPIIVLSGRHERPDETPARWELAYTLGAMPMQVRGENTKEEIEKAIQVAHEDLTLVTSAYHAPRVLLTAVAALARVGRERQLRVWIAEAPSDESKRELEEQKIAAYQATGDVASWDAGRVYVAWRDGCV